MKKEKYYLKSLLRTIKKQPLQIILILFILILSFITLNVNFSISSVLTSNETAGKVTKYGTSEIVISNNSTSSSRFILKDDVEEVLDNATVTGTFNIPFTSGENLLLGMAVDLETVNEIFTFSFTEYETFNYEDRDRVIFIYEDYAKENNIKLNDIINLSLFGINDDYRVVGISSTPFFEDCYALCDIKVAINALSKSSPYISTFAYNLDLYGTVYIKTCDGNINNALELLKEKYKDKNIEIVNLNNRNEKGISNAISIFMSILCFVMTFAVLLTSIYNINNQRKEQSDLFNLVGYSKKRIIIYRCLEMGLYCVITGVIGTYLSTFISKLSYSLIGVKFVSYKLSILYAFISFIMLFICSLIPIIVSNNKAKIEKHKKELNRNILFLTIINIILVICTVLINGLYKFYVATIALILLFISIALLTKILIDIVSNILVKKAKSVHSKIAYKNLKKIGEIANVTKLVCVFGTVVITGIAILLSSISMTISADHYIAGDYMINGLGSNIEESLDGIDEIDSYSRFYMSNKQFTYEGKDVIVWSFDNLEGIGKAFTYDTLPKGNEIYTSYVYAGKYGLKENDKITLVYNDKPYDFVIKETTNSVDFMFLIDINYVNEDYNYYIVNGKDNISKTSFYSSLTTKLATKMVTIVPPRDMLKNIVARQSIFKYFCALILFIIFVFGSIGIFNILYDSKKARTIEYEYYSICGMSKKDIKTMTKKESSFAITFASIYTIINSILMLIVVNDGMITYGGVLFPLIKFLFKILNNIL